MVRASKSCGQREQGLNPQPQVTAADERMARRREEIVRLVQFCLVGGCVATFNLVLTYLMSRQETVPYSVYVPVIIEITICISFAFNDVLTFSKLKQGGRGWWMRLLRFHGSAALGAITQITVSFIAFHFFDLAPVIAQFIAIGCATVVNFSMHRFWTYRKPRVTAAPDPAPLVTAPPMVPETLD